MTPEQVKAIFPWATQREAYPWQQRLQMYSQPQWRQYAIQDLIYTKAVAEDRARQGLPFTDQQDWATKIRMAAGLPDYLYGPGVTSDQAYANYLAEYVPQQPTQPTQLVTPTQPAQQPSPLQPAPLQAAAEPFPWGLVAAITAILGFMFSYLTGRR